MCAALCWLCWGGPAIAQFDDYNRPPINYEEAEVNDAIFQLSEKLDAGELTLDYDADRGGYLLSVLEALEVPISSQVLVFSKTSLQLRRISPRRPRAIYFNDDVYVGFSQQGDLLELAATDPHQGAIFYTLEQSPESRPRFLRDQNHCLVCHASTRTQNVPGYFIRSVYPDKSGQPELGQGSFTTNHTSPFHERWGGWYVTGTHGSMRHMGNAIFDKTRMELDVESQANITSLDELVSTKPYPGSHSDIVALMVLEYQTQLHNAIAWANYETRRAIHQSEVMNTALDRPAGHLSESCERRIERAADRVLQYLLLCDEFPLSAPVQGTSGFAEEFQAKGNRDAQGRSLRDLDLSQRLFRYPCGYLIYSPAFSALPDEVRSRILVKLLRILDGTCDTEEQARYAHLSEQDRSNIREILSETHPEFAATLKDAASLLDEPVLLEQSKGASATAPTADSR